MNLSSIYKLATDYEKEFLDDHNAYMKTKLHEKLMRVLNQGNPKFIDYTADNLVEVHPHAYEVNVLLMQSPTVEASHKNAKDLSHEQFMHMVNSLGKELQSAFRSSDPFLGSEPNTLHVYDEQSDACEMMNVSIFISRSKPRPETHHPDGTAINPMVLDEGEPSEMDGD